MIAWIIARPAVVLAVVVFLTLPLAAGLAKLEIRTDGEALHPAGDPIVEATARDREVFRDPDAVIVLLEPHESGASLFTPAGLARLQLLTSALRSTPGARSDGVTSLATVVDVTGSARMIRLSRVLDPLPRDGVSIRRLRERLRGSRLYEGLLYGRDGRSATIFVPLSGTEGRGKVVERIRRIATDCAGHEYRALLAGPVVAEALLGDQVLADLKRLVPLVVLVVAGTLFIGLRSATGTAVPLVQMLCVLVWTFGLMGWARVPLTLVSSILPVLIMAMAMSDQIHLHERFRAHRGQGLERKAAVAISLAEVGPPIAKSAISTALGFLAFTTTSVRPLRDFGIFAALGFILSMVLSYTLVPALLVVIPERRRGLVREPDAPQALRVGHSAAPEAWLAARPRAALITAAAIIVIAALGWPRLVVQDSWVQNFSAKSDLVAAERLFNAQYGGSYRMDVVLEGATHESFFSARGVRAVDSLETALASFPEVGSTLSWVDLAESALRGVDSTRRVVALDDAAVSGLQQVLQMTGSEDRLDQLITPPGDRIRILCFVPNADYAKSNRLLARLDSLAARFPLAPGVSIRASGSIPVAATVVRATVVNQVRSVAWAFAGLGLLLAISFRSIPLATAMLVPVAGTTVAVFGGMGYAGVPLGVATSMFAALAEGEGTNFAVHVVSRFLAERQSSPADRALRGALRDVGPAVRWNAVALIAGCAVLCLSTLRPVRALGALLAVGLALSYLLTMMVLPGLLLALDRSASRRGKPFGLARHAALIGFGLATLFAAAPASADATSSRLVDEASARRIMTDIERSQRKGARLFSMDITLTYAAKLTTHRRMLGVTCDDSAETRLLYVVTTPRIYRGSSLLIRDPSVPHRRTRMWVHMPSLHAFREIESAAMNLLVPGTGFTFDDSRGWIATDRYRLKMLTNGPKEIAIEATPQSDSLADVVGSARLIIRVDPKRRVISGVVFYDRAGNLVRTYEATEFVEIAGRWFPARVKTHQRVQLLDAEIVYGYAELPRSPPADLFRPALEPAPFLERLEEWRDRAGYAAAFPDSVVSP